MSTILEGKNPRKPYTLRYWTPDRRQHEKSFATKAEAEAFARTAKAIGDPGAEKFRDYAERWIDQTAASKVPSKVRHDRGTLKNHINPAIGDIPLKSATREMCKKLLLDSGLTPAVSDSVRILLNAVFNEAVRDKRIAENPAHGIRVKYNSKRAELIPVSYAQMLVIENELNPEYRLALWLMYGLGLRIGEALAAREDCVRDDGAAFRAKESAASEHKGSEPILNPLKKRNAGEFRDIPLPRWLLDKINAHVAAFGTVDGYLFPKFAIEGKDTHNWRAQFNRGKVKAGCPSTAVSRSF